MARIKHYNHNTQQWEYSDISYSVQQGSDIDYEEVNELINAAIENKADKSDIPTSLPASDVYEWAKAVTKPAYTAEEVGLGNVPNVTTNDQTPTYSEASTLVALTSGEKLSVALGKIKKAIADLIAHIINKSNPHEVTAEQIGAATTTQLNSLSKIYIQLDAPTNPKVGDVWIDTDEEAGEVLAAVATSGNYNDLINRPTSMTPTTHTHTRSEITDFPTSMPASDVSAWAKASTKPTYTASEVGADASGTATGLINRTNAVNAANTSYTTYMARGESLNSSETNPGINGAIAWQYA